MVTGGHHKGGRGRKEAAAAAAASEAAAHAAAEASSIRAAERQDSGASGPPRAGQGRAQEGGPCSTSSRCSPPRTSLCREVWGVERCGVKNIIPGGEVSGSVLIARFLLFGRGCSTFLLGTLQGRVLVVL